MRLGLNWPKLTRLSLNWHKLARTGVNWEKKKSTQIGVSSANRLLAECSVRVWRPWSHLCFLGHHTKNVHVGAFLHLCTIHIYPCKCFVSHTCRVSMQHCFVQPHNLAQPSLNTRRAQCPHNLLSMIQVPILITNSRVHVLQQIFRI